MTRFGPASSPVQTNAYDGDGLRTWKQTGTGSSTRTYFVYGGDTAVVEEASTGAFLAGNTYGADGLASTRRNGPGTTCFVFDERGNVAQRTSSSGAAQSSDMYDGYGGRTSTGGADSVGFGGQWGYYTNADNGLILCTHRFYDPQNGRWLTPDPAGYAGGINQYAYCQNNPANQIDSLGLWSIGITLSAIGVAPGLGGGADSGIVIGDAGIAWTSDWYAGSGIGLGASIGPAFNFSFAPQPTKGGQQGFGIVSGFTDAGVGFGGGATYSPGGWPTIFGGRGGPSWGVGSGAVIGAGNSYTSDVIPWNWHNPFANESGPLPTTPYSCPVGPGMPPNNGPGPGSPGSMIPM